MQTIESNVYNYIVKILKEKDLVNKCTRLINMASILNLFIVRINKH
jgi:hypothetical protein